MNILEPKSPFLQKKQVEIEVDDTVSDFAASEVKEYCTTQEKEKEEEQEPTVMSDSNQEYL